MDDFISRRAAIDELGEEPEVWSGEDEYEMGLNNQWHSDVIALKSLPAADVAQVRHGRWETEIITDVYGLKHACYACSVCGVANNDEYDFCPNCGAKMDGGEDDER